MNTADHMGYSPYLIFWSGAAYFRYNTGGWSNVNCIASPPYSIFGHEGSAADDILYVNWLNMVRAGLQGLEYYSPENKKWRQVHTHKHSLKLSYQENHSNHD